MKKKKKRKDSFFSGSDNAIPLKSPHEAADVFKSKLICHT